MKSGFKHLQFRQILTLVLAGMLWCFGITSSLASSLVPFSSMQLVAANPTVPDEDSPVYLGEPDFQKPNVERKNPGLQYPGPEEKKQPLPLKQDQEVVPEISGQRQRVINRSDVDEQILEKTGKALKEGSEFLPGLDGSD